MYWARAVYASPTRSRAGAGATRCRECVAAGTTHRGCPRARRQGATGGVPLLGCWPDPAGSAHRVPRTHEKVIRTLLDERQERGNRRKDLWHPRAHAAGTDVAERVRPLRPLVRRARAKTPRSLESPQTRRRMLEGGVTVGRVERPAMNTIRRRGTTCTKGSRAWRGHGRAGAARPGCGATAITSRTRPARPRARPMNVRTSGRRTARRATPTELIAWKARSRQTDGRPVPARRHHRRPDIDVIFIMYRGMLWNEEGGARSPKHGTRHARTVCRPPWRTRCGQQGAASVLWQTVRRQAEGTDLRRLLREGTKRRSCGVRPQAIWSREGGNVELVRDACGHQQQREVRHGGFVTRS